MHISRLVRILAATGLAGACAGHPAGVTTSASPAVVADELLAADRAYAAASERTDVAAGLEPMLAPGVIMPVPGGFAVGRDSVLAAIRANPANAGARLGWTPVRVGVSADGSQGFTFGYTTLLRGDSLTPGKYLTYWVRGGDGWRAAMYKRGRAAGAAKKTPAPMPPALPAGKQMPSGDSAATERFRQSLDSAERAFSRDAQVIGLEKAFVRYGSPDAVNMGGGSRERFVVGPDSIGALVSDGEPATGSSVSWAPDRKVIVASSGDLGITMGTIVLNEPDSTGARASFPFTTVWRRPSPDQPWRYVAE